MRRSLPLPRPRLHEKSRLRDVTQRLVFVAIALVFINLLTSRYRVQGTSMQPTVFEGDVLLLNRIAYQIGTPQRGDIVVIHRPDLSDYDLIKRVIGLPGETIELRDGRLFVDGSEFSDPFACETCSEGVWIMGAADYFVMGDHRIDSRDSRAFGAVARRDLVGKVIWRYWPLASFGRVP